MPNVDNIKDKEEIEKLYNTFIEGSKKAKSKIIVKIIGRVLKIIIIILFPLF